MADVYTAPGQTPRAWRRSCHEYDRELPSHADAMGATDRARAAPKRSGRNIAAGHRCARNSPHRLSSAASPHGQCAALSMEYSRRLFVRYYLASRARAKNSAARASWTDMPRCVIDNTSVRWSAPPAPSRVRARMRPRAPWLQVHGHRVNDPNEKQIERPSLRPDHSAGELRDSRT